MGRDTSKDFEQLKEIIANMNFDLSIAERSSGGFVDTSFVRGYRSAMELVLAVINDMEKQTK